ncbi:hypothetical protein HaLaN_22901 [Haematococcus lacustris]|uniref:Uncharacterized protein n=1 Tax=Haematococcus lacustris TaxID=44745 RepID=A0A699ZRP3_HAELA|nr:hypothetical protein HaLaN_22901 [Haematococcus lacustris]
MAEAASVRQCAAWVLEAVQQAEAAHAKGLEGEPVGSVGAVAPLWLHLRLQHSLLRAAPLWHQTSLLLLMKICVF